MPKNQTQQDDKPAAKKKGGMSPEARQRASDRMKKLHEEGRAGPQFGKLGGRPRKKRATEHIAEAAADDAEKLLSVLRDAIDPTQPISIRMAATKQYTEIERGEAKLQMEEEDHTSKMTKDELATRLSAQILNNPIVAQRFAELLAEKNGNGVTHVDAEQVEELENPDDD